MSRPDVILILTDEERAAPAYEPLEVTAWRRDHLPGRRWFSDNGVDFKRHYVAATACVPSRPSMLTGHYPDVHGVTQTDGLGKNHGDTRMRWLRPDEVPTMGHWFRAAGYDTHYDGKWHVSHADLMVDGRPLATNTNDGAVIPKAVQAYLDADPLEEFGFSGWVGPEPHGGRAADSGYVRDPLIADRVVAWLADRYERRAAGDAAAAKPFLLVCSFVNPHDIVLWPLFMRRGKPFPPSVAEPPAIPASPTDGEDLRSKPAVQSAFRDAYYSAYGPTRIVRRSYEKNLDDYRQTYYRMHHDVDGPIDRVRQAVTSGSEDAVLVFSADHGDMLGSHGGMHQKWYQLYDEAVRVPFTIARTGPFATSGAIVDDAPTSHVDLLPTMLAFAEVDVDAVATELATRHREVHPLPGRDLSGVVADPSTAATGDGVYVFTRDNMMEGDGSASAAARQRGQLEPPFPLQIRIPAHAATNVEALVVRHGESLWKIVRTFDDPATWSEPHVRHLSARTPGGPRYRTEPIPDQWELYDLDQDSAEAMNLALSSDHAETLAALTEAMRAKRAACVPERNEAWPYAVRPERATPRRKKPPAPARRLRMLVQRLGMHPDDPEAVALDASGRRALIVATNHGTLELGKPTGVFASELTAPYYVFADAGMQVDIASPRGGDVPFDPKSFRPVIRSEHDDRFLADDDAKGACSQSLAIGEIDVEGYDIVFFAGGWGAAFDLGLSEAVGAQVSAAAASGAVLGGVCHGPLGFLKAVDAEGHPFVEGRRLTAVTDKQVRELGITATPQHPETELRRLGAEFESATGRRDALANHVVEDGDLITGQNQNAAPMVARLMVQRMLANESDLEVSD
jgi:arylsulfatase A-like enzyme/putative intracellular protease/amidase